MTFHSLIDPLFKQGLGELLILPHGIDSLYIGNFIYEKGHILFKDRGMVDNTDIITPPESWTPHLLGMVCYRKLYEWKSLTFYGVNHCQLSTGVDPDQFTALASIDADASDLLRDFVGSIYRAYKHMLRFDLLPVILLQQINTVDGQPGLGVYDSNALNLPWDTLNHIKITLRESIKKTSGY